MPGTPVWPGVNGARSQRNRIGSTAVGEPARGGTAIRMAVNTSHRGGARGVLAALALTRELLTMPEDTCLTSPIFADREDFHDQ